MEWCIKVEELLQKNLKLGEDLKDFKTANLEKLSEDSRQFDECLDANSNEVKCLWGESDGLLANSMSFSVEIQVLEDAQKKQFSKTDKKIEKEGLAVNCTNGRLTHMSAWHLDDQEWSR